MGLQVIITHNDSPSEYLTSHLSSVEVQERMDENTTYKLQFLVDICDNDLGAQIQREAANGNILSVLVLVNDTLHCLVKGPVTKQNTALQNGGAGSTLTIEGEDTGYLMDVETQQRQTLEGSDADLVRAIMGRQPGMQADVVDTADSTHSEDTHSHVQVETDLELLRTLARRNGAHFWITYDNSGVATGHFKRRSLDASSQVNLLINHPEYNIESASLTADTRRPVETQGSQLNTRSLETMDAATSASDEPLGPTDLRSAAGSNAQTRHLAAVTDDEAALQRRSEAALAEAQWFISASCRTSTARLCAIIRWHSLINLQGAGSRYSGKYYVTAVKHTIDAANHFMDIEMARNAWGDESPVSGNIPAILS